MRDKRTTQTSLLESDPVDHSLGEELESISNWLDAHTELLDAAAADLGARNAVGRAGLSCETVLRCAVLKHLRGETWRDLAFALTDSLSARRFVRLEPLPPPKKSALQAAVCAVSAETWERVNRSLLDAVLAVGVETGGRMGRSTPETAQPRAGSTKKRPSDTWPPRIGRNRRTKERSENGVYGHELVIDERYFFLHYLSSSCFNVKEYSINATRNYFCPCCSPYFLYYGATNFRDGDHESSYQ